MATTDTILFYIATAFYMLWLGLTWKPAKKGKAPVFPPSHALTIGWLLNIAYFPIRYMLVGYVPLVSFFETLVFMSSLIATVIFVIHIIVKSGNVRKLMFAVLLMNAITLLVDKAPAENGSTLELFGLVLHVPLALGSYGFFIMSLIMSGLYLFAGKKRNDSTYYDKAYRFTRTGFILLVIATITGGIWAYVAWGSFWGWDPKETMTLVILVSYLISILFFRFSRNKTLNAAVSIFSFIFVVINYIYINFFLTGLHSYV